MTYPAAAVTEADVVAAAVLSCPAVDGLCSGPWGGVVTYLPGRQVPGIRLADDHLVISVRARWGVAAAELAAQVRAAVTGLAGSRRIDIVLADMTDRDPGVSDVPAGLAPQASWPGERKMA